MQVNVPARIGTAAHHRSPGRAHQHHTTPTGHGRSTTAFGATMRPVPATERRSNARARACIQVSQADAPHSSPLPCRPRSPAPHSPPPPHSPQHVTDASNTRNTHHTHRVSPAYFRGMHRCTSGRSCVQLRADDPLDSCVGCIVLVQRVCILCVLYVWMSSVMLSIHLFTHMCPC